MVIHCDTTRYIAEVLEKGEYSFLFRDDYIVLDLGCNIGTFSLWIYPLAAKIYAVDCDEKVLNLFKETIKDNNLDKIEVFKERMLDGSETSGSMSAFLKGRGIKHVDIVKMDIEGDEIAVVEAPDFPSDKITTIIGELHFSDERRDKFIQRLKALGYVYAEFPGDPTQAIHFKATKI